MTVLLGAAPSTIAPSEVGAWMAAKGAPGAAVLLDFAGQKCGFRNAAGVPRRGSLATDLTFARASAASYIDAAGHVQFAASGQPRFTHDATTFAPLGFLAEAARTNALSNPVWAGPDAPTSWASIDVVGVSTIPSKFGPNVGARRFTATGNRPRVYQSVTLTAGVTYTVSVMIEALTGSTPAQWVIFANVLNTTITYPVCDANPAGGAYGALQPGLFVFQIVSTVTQAANVQFGLGAQSAQSGVVIDLSMPQVEAGTWPTSFIPSGTRAADRLTLTLPFDAHDEGFTIAAKGRLPRWTNPSSSNLYAFGPSSLGTRLSTYSVVPGQVFVSASGAPAPFSPASSVSGLPTRQPVRTVISGTPTGNYLLCINGGAVQSRVGNPMPAGSTFLDVGNLIGPYAWGDAVESIAIWRGTPHSDAGLQGLLA